MNAREDDEGGIARPYCYTTLTNLWQIMDAEWGLFTDHVPRARAGDKPGLKRDLGRLKTIRNKVMHPVRDTRPTQEDFDFVREMHRALSRDKWRDVPGWPREADELRGAPGAGDDAIYVIVETT